MKLTSLLFIIGAVIIFCGCNTPKNVTTTADDNGSLLIWKKDQPLLWTDFRAPADVSVEWSAVTISFIGYQTLTKNKTLIGAYFNRDQSWHIRSREDLLNHEQFHFHITEIFAREMRKKVAGQKLKPSSDEFQNLYTKLVKDCAIMQKDYDDITHHGKDKTAQTIQEKIISDRLAELTAFENSVVEY